MDRKYPAIGMQSFRGIISELADVAMNRYVGDSAIRFFFSLFLPLALIYGITASWQLPINYDTLTNSITAWHLGKTGSIYLDGYEHLAAKPYNSVFGYYVITDKGIVSQYPPGAPFLAAPFYAFAPGDLVEMNMLNPARPELGVVKMRIPPLGPAAIVTVMATAAAIAFLGLVFSAQGDRKEAWFAAWVAGLGTSAWSVASDALWQHGPAMLWIALGIYLASRGRFWGAGWAFGLSILTRPLTAVISACLGIVCGLSDRSIFTIVKVGFGSAVGLCLLISYNALIFGEVSVSGGYDNVFESRLISFEWWSFGLNILGGLLDPRVGFLVWSPFFILLIPGLFAGWRHSDRWVRGAAIGGLFYLLLQYKMNRYFPDFMPYRYPLEALTASAPLWFSVYLHQFRKERCRLRRMFFYLVLVGFFLQLVAALVG